MVTQVGEKHISTGSETSPSQEGGRGPSVPQIFWDPLPIHRATMLGMVTHTGQECVLEGQHAQVPRGRGPSASRKFLGPLRMPKRFDL